MRLRQKLDILLREMCKVLQKHMLVIKLYTALKFISCIVSSL